jgi:hypothetical protein
MSSPLKFLSTGYSITDEIINRSSSTALVLGHDTIRDTTDLEIWTGIGKTGTKLTINTDYTVSDIDTAQTTIVGVNIYTKLAIVNGAYQNIDLYGNYKTIGDYSSPESIRKGSGEIGDIKPWPYHSVQNGDWSWADGGSLARASYPAFFETACFKIGTATISIASPGVVTKAAHGFITGDCVFFETTGALPTGLSANTAYYVIYVGTGTFRLATTRALADAGTAINTSGSQSGVHTLRACPFGIDSATTFLKPDLREVAIVGVGTRASGVYAHDAYRDGEQKDDQTGDHRHAIKIFPSGSSGNPATIIASLSGNRGNAVDEDATAIVAGSGLMKAAADVRSGTVTRGKRIGMKYVVRVL